MLTATGGLFLGKDLLLWLVLAVGGALFVGNMTALVRPPTKARADDLARAPVARTVVMGAVGAVAALWAVASLLSR